MGHAFPDGFESIVIKSFIFFGKYSDTLGYSEESIFRLPMNPLSASAGLEMRHN